MSFQKTRAWLNNKFISTCVLMFITGNLFACDICGCFMGITPYDNQSNIGIIYRYRSFNGYEGQSHKIFPTKSSFLIPSDKTDAPLTGHNGNQHDYEIYRTTEIRARYFLHKRIEFTAIIPYNSNSERYNNYTSTISGLGDINLYGGYHILRKLNTAGINQRLIVGTGVKLPSGRYDVKNNDGIRYSSLHQPGTGSTDGFVYANYLIGYKKIGLSWNAGYKFNGDNKFDEGIANSTTQFVNLFYQYKMNKAVTLIPAVQTFYEYSGGETYQGQKTGEHKTDNLMSGIGLDIFYKNLTFNSGIQFNITSAATAHPLSAAKIHLGLTYNFKQLYYLINSK